MTTYEYLVGTVPALSWSPCAQGPFTLGLSGFFALEAVITYAQLPPNF